jgi:hypothetical protein
LNLKCIQTAVARDCNWGPPISPWPPLFWCRLRAAHTCATREHRGRAAAGHAALPDRLADPTPPTPHRRVAPPAACPPPLTTSPIKDAPSPSRPHFLFPLLPHERAPEHSVTPSSLSLTSCPRRPTGLPPLCRLHATTPLILPPQ